MHHISSCLVPVGLKNFDKPYIFFCFCNGVLNCIINCLTVDIWIYRFGHLYLLLKLLKLIAICACLACHNCVRVLMQCIHNTFEARIKVVCLCHEVGLTCKLDHSYLLFVWILQNANESLTRCSVHLFLGSGEAFAPEILLTFLKITITFFESLHTISHWRTCQSS